MALGPGPAGLKFWTPSGTTADNTADINNLPAGVADSFYPWGPKRPVADWVRASPSFLISPADTDNLPAGGANWFNPWGRKRPVADWFRGPIPTVPVTFTADSGSYALTGSAAFQALGHAAGSGSYITGSAAGLVMPFTLPAAAGSYALTGSSISFVTVAPADTTNLPGGMTGGYVPWGRRFPINLRSLTGRPLGEAAAPFTLTAADGSYTLTGSAASFVILDTTNLPAGGANWFNPWRRQYPVSLRTGISRMTATGPFTLTAAGGSYAITGSAASFVNLAPPDTTNLPAGMTGSYVPWRRPHPVSLRTITGRPLATTFILTCGAGSYTLIGGATVSFISITPPTTEQPGGTYVGRPAGAGRGRMIRRRKPGELDLEPPPLEPSPPDLPPPAPGPKPPDLLPPQPGLMADMPMPQPKPLPPYVDEDEDEIALLLGLIS